MITDENHPLMVEAQAELTRRLKIAGAGRRLDKYVMHDMFEVVRTHRLQCRARYIEFPKLVALVVPRLGIIAWNRADLSAESIRTSVVNFARMYPTISMEEIVQAFKAAWPHMKPDDFAAPTDQIRQALAKKAEKEENSQ